MINGLNTPRGLIKPDNIRQYLRPWYDGLLVQPVDPGRNPLVTNGYSYFYINEGLTDTESGNYHITNNLDGTLYVGANGWSYLDVLNFPIAVIPAFTDATVYIGGDRIQMLSTVAGYDFVTARTSVQTPLTQTSSVRPGYGITIESCDNAPPANLTFRNATSRVYDILDLTANVQLAPTRIPVQGAFTSEVNGLPTDYNRMSAAGATGVTVSYFVSNYAGAGTSTLTLYGINPDNTKTQLSQVTLPHGSTVPQNMPAVTLAIPELLMLEAAPIPGADDFVLSQLTCQITF